MIMAALVEARTGRLADLIARGNPLLIDGERFLDRLWPNILPERFEDLRLPFLAVATDYYGRTEAVFYAGPLLPAVASSMAIPGLVKPVRHGGRLLVMGAQSIRCHLTISSAAQAYCRGRRHRRTALSDPRARRLCDNVRGPADHAGCDRRGEAQALPS